MAASTSGGSESRQRPASGTKPHMTRHTFATDVLDAAEGDLHAVKELLSHSSTALPTCTPRGLGQPLRWRHSASTPSNRQTEDD
jgi:hypothetical protein